MAMVMDCCLCLHGEHCYCCCCYVELLLLLMIQFVQPGEKILLCAGGMMGQFANCFTWPFKC